jgi:hypothetical protein
MARAIMSFHKFKVGQSVNLTPNRLEGHVPAGTYTIQRPLPIEARGIEYRVKNTRDGHERVVHESRLTAVGQLVAVGTIGSSERK